MIHYLKKHLHFENKMSNLYYHSNLGVLGKKVSSDVLQTTLEYIFKSLKKKNDRKKKAIYF